VVHELSGLPLSGGQTPRSKPRRFSLGVDLLNVGWEIRTIVPVLLLGNHDLASQFVSGIQLQPEVVLAFVLWARGGGCVSSPHEAVGALASQLLDHDLNGGFPMFSKSS
jgi:hypothetical protein